MLLNGGHASFLLGPRRRCAFTAAAAYGGGADEVFLNNTAGTGGSGASLGVTGGSAGAGGSPVCEGGYGSAGASALSEATKCYISEPGQGEAECLPVTDATLAERLQDFLSSEGYAVAFVLGDAEKVPLSASCEPLLECCSSIAGESEARRCRDWLENPLSTTLVDGCPVQHPSPYGSTSIPRFTESFCPDISEPDAGQSPDAAGDAATIGQGDAGSQEAPSHSLCCYSVCRYLHWP